MNVRRRVARGRLGLTRHTVPKPWPRAGRFILPVVASTAAEEKPLFGNTGFPVVARNSE